MTSCYRWRLRPFDVQVLPDYILAVMLIVLLAATANRTLRKGIKSFNKETLAKQVGLCNHVQEAEEGGGGAP